MNDQVFPEDQCKICVNSLKDDSNSYLLAKQWVGSNFVSL